MAIWNRTDLWSWVGACHMRCWGESDQLGLVVVVRPALCLCLNWFKGLEFPAESFLAGRLVTRTCCIAAWTSSSSMEYLFAHLNKSSIVVGGFLVRDSKKGVPGHILLLKICRTTSMLQDSTWSIACLNRFTNFLKDLVSCIFMFFRVLMFYLCHAKHRYCPIKASDRSQKLFVCPWNHEKVWSWRLTGKTLHNSASFPISRVMSCL